MNIIVKFLFSILLIFLIAGLLYSTNLLPYLADKGVMRPYESLDAVRENLRVDKIVLPTYFPEEIAWPPKFILAQKTPFFALVMEFNRHGSNETSLIIVQSEVYESLSKLDRLVFSTVSEQAEHLIKSKKVTVQAGICKGNIKCSKVTGQMDNMYFSVSSVFTPIELLRIADSMMR